MQPMVLPRESISSIYAVVIPVRPLFATSSSAQSTDIHSDTVFGTPLRRACGASCIRLRTWKQSAVGACVCRCATMLRLSTKCFTQLHRNFCILYYMYIFILSS